jgi:hypothetical protein
MGGAALAAVLLTLVAAPARATPNFPAAMQSDLGLSYTPSCSICHEGGVTGATTVTTPFGLALIANGIVPYDVASLDAALVALTASNPGYIQALQQGTDPNAAADAGTDGVGPPGYGCTEGPERTSGGVSVLEFGTLVALAYRRRRHPRGRGKAL